MRLLSALAICFVAIMNASCSEFVNNFPQLWGMWNEGEEEKAVYNGINSTGLYAVTFNRLSFEPGKGSTPRISTHGYAFFIIKIQGTFPQYDISVETAEQKSTGNAPQKYLRGQIRMHFIDSDQMWLECSDLPRNDEGFPVNFFQGKSRIYWRAKKIEKPLAETD